MPPNKKCFVVMPIKREGSEEHRHYRALYSNFLRPILESAGYEVVRADEVAKTGAITKDIITRLADADLVIADITDLNPNVFYELGIRHALRSYGTVMILDELRSDSIPFDISAYRVIRFRSDIEGIAKLNESLLAFASSLSDPVPEHPDNPVHDWLPNLPSNLLESNAGRTETALRETIDNLKKQLKAYELKIGPLPTEIDVSTPQPMNILLSALAEAERGNLPDDLLRKAEASAADGDIKRFLEAVRAAFEQETFVPSEFQFRMLAQLSERLGLTAISAAIYDFARSRYPDDKDLRIAQLSYFSHSKKPGDRERARREHLNDLRIVLTDEGVEIPSTWSSMEAARFGILLDSFSRDERHAEGLRLTSAAVEVYPTNSTILRNHARSLRWIGKFDDALQWFRAALFCPDVDGQTPAWLATELHNVQRRVDAVEAYLVACRLNPNDASYFSNAADSLAIGIVEAYSGTVSGQRTLPEGIGIDAVTRLLCAALSCRDFGANDAAMCRRASSHLEIDWDALLAVVRTNVAGSAEEFGRYELARRIELITSLYSRFRSDLTDPPLELRANLLRRPRTTLSSASSDLLEERATGVEGSALDPDPNVLQNT